MGYEAGDVTGFHVRNFPAGHKPTNFTKWLDAEEPYQVEYQHCFEPYVLMRRDTVPSYDERFRGYGMNKIVHLMAISKTAQFHVLPKVWLMAIPHERSRDWHRTLASKHSERDRFLEMQALFEVVKNELRATPFLPNEKNDSNEYHT